MSKQLVLLLTIFWLLIIASPAVCQNSEIYGTAANPADMNDPFAHIVNPALSEMTFDQVAAGYRVLHLGLLNQAAGLNTGQIAYSGRRLLGGVAAGFGYLNTPIWSESHLSFGWGKRIWKGVSIGLGGGVNQRGFNKGDLYVDDVSDPLLAGSLSRTVPTTRLALMWTKPLWGLTTGLVLENPHEPNVSLTGDDNVVLGRVWRWGVGFEDNGVHIKAGLVDNEFGTHYSSSGRIFLIGGSSLTARFGQQNWGVGARFVISDLLFVDYEFSLPRSELATETSGTHGIAVCFHSFGRVERAESYSHRDLIDHKYNPELAAPRQLIFPEVKPFNLPLLQSQSDLYCVKATVDTALIRVKRLKREFQPLVDMTQIRQLPSWRIGVLDTSWSDNVTYSVTQGMQPAEPENELPQGSYTPEYMQSVAQLGQELKLDANSGVSLVANADQLDRARYLAGKMAQQGEIDYETNNEQINIYQMATLVDRDLWHRLNRPVGNNPIPTVEQTTLYEFANIPFVVYRVGGQEQIRDWSWQLSDSFGNSIRTLGGMSAPPDTIWWDWRDETGEIVPIDDYNYTFSWSNTDDAIFRLPTRQIMVARQVMQRSLVFGKNELPAQPLHEGKTTIILDPGRRSRNRTNQESNSAREDSTSIQ